MSRQASVTRRTLVVALLAVIAAGTPVEAQQGARAFTGPGGALAARTIGFLCVNSLSADELYDLDLYLAHKRIAGLKGPGSDRSFEARLYPSLEAGYIAKYRQAENCTADAVEQAKATVAWAREELKAIQR